MIDLKNWVDKFNNNLYYYLHKLGMDKYTANKFPNFNS